MVIWSYSGDDFKSLGRHFWRRKKRMYINNGDQQSQQQSHSQELLDSGNINTSLSSSNSYSVKCSCGKICKWLWPNGLNMHQCICRVVKDLTDATFALVEANLTSSYNNDNCNEDWDNSITNFIPDVKPGVKLPKSVKMWICFHGLTTNFWTTLVKYRWLNRSYELNYLKLFL